ncbi:hypothetical protein MMC21_000402 [Puttea exsequens]|nr:hypothetical protein [Puttea exsequens]
MISTWANNYDPPQNRSSPYPFSLAEEFPVTERALKEPLRPTNLPKYILRAPAKDLGVFPERHIKLGSGEPPKFLRSLSNLRKVTIIGGPSTQPGNDWYLTRGPSAWDWAPTVVRPTYWSYYDEPSYQKWNGRPLLHFLRAPQTHHRVTELVVGNRREGAGMHSAFFAIGLPLSSLNLSHEPRRRQVFSIESTIHLLRIRWRYLRSLDLQDVEIDVDAWLEFLMQHRDTLKHLVLWSVMFEANKTITPTITSWKKLMQASRQILRFETANIYVGIWSTQEDD